MNDDPCISIRAGISPWLRIRLMEAPGHVGVVLFTATLWPSPSHIGQNVSIPRFGRDTPRNPNPAPRDPPNRGIKNFVWPANAC